MAEVQRGTSALGIPWIRKRLGVKARRIARERYTALRGDFMALAVATRGALTRGTSLLPPPPSPLPLFSPRHIGLQNRGTKVGRPIMEVLFSIPPSSRSRAEVLS